MHQIFLINSKILSDWENSNISTLSLTNIWVYLKFPKLVTNNSLRQALVHFHFGKMIIGYPTESKQIDIPLKVILYTMTN